MMTQQGSKHLVMLLETQSILKMQFVHALRLVIRSSLAGPDTGFYVKSQDVVGHLAAADCRQHRVQIVEEECWFEKVDLLSQAAVRRHCWEEVGLRLVIRVVWIGG